MALQAIAASVAVGFLLSPEGSATLGDSVRLGLEGLAAATAGAAYAISEPAGWLPAGDDVDSGSWLALACAIALAGNVFVFVRGSRSGHRVWMACLTLVILLAVGDSSLAASALQEGETERAMRESLDALKLLALGAILTASGIGAGALAMSLRAMFPRLIGMADLVTATRSALLAFFVGLFNAILVLVVAVLLVRVPGPPRFLGVVLLLAMSAVIATGLAARLRTVGQAIAASSSPAIQDMTGAIVLAAVMLCPVVGQVFWIGVLVQAFGVGLLSVLQQRERRS